MPSLHDLAIDLINDAKSANLKSKLFNLEQIKEIVFHRDTSILPELAPDIINDFMVDRSPSIRKFLVSFTADWLKHDFVAAVPLSLSLYSFLLVSESTDTQLRLIAHELTKYYDRIVLHIAGLPPKSKSSGPNAADPKAYWGQLRSIVSRLLDMISSDRTEYLRTQLMRLAEVMVMFGLPAEQVSLDPRLARSRRAAPGADTKSSGSGASDIPLTHPFINRNELEQESESLFSKMLLWCSRGGPQGHPFNATQMNSLGIMVSNIASLRPKKSSVAAPALVFLLQGKGNQCQQMTGPERDQLARSIQKLLKAAYALADPDNVMGKLRAAMDALVAMGLGPAADGTQGATGGEGSVLAKRPGVGGEEDLEGDDAEPGESEELGGTTKSALRASAIAAVDAAENSYKIKDAKLGEGAGVSGAGAAAGAAATTTPGLESVTAAAGPTVTADTELAADLADFPDLSAAAREAKMVTLQAPLTTAVGKTPVAGSGIESSSGILIKTAPVGADVYGEFALKSIHRLLDSYEDVKNSGPKAAQAHLKLTARMVVSMAMNEMVEGKQAVRVPVVASLSPAATGPLVTGVPLEVTMPRVLWLALSYALSTTNASHAPQTAKVHQIKGLPQEKIDLIIHILKEIHARIVQSRHFVKEEPGDAEVETEASKRHPFEDLYEGICIVVLSRTLQAVLTRPSAKEIFMALPDVPHASLGVLKLLVYTGTKAVAPPQGARRDQTQPRNRGTRAEALSLLGQLVYSDDQNAGTAALNSLCWCALADDFEIRAKAISLLVGEVMPAEDWVFETIATFASHSLIACIGSDIIAERTAEYSSYAAMTPLAAAAAAKSSSASEGDRMDVADETKEAEASSALEASITLSQALEKFDNGESFGASFPVTPAWAATAAATSKEKIEAHVRKSLQMISQVCVAEPSMLAVFFAVYGAAAAMAAREREALGQAAGSDTSASVQNESKAAESTDGSEKTGQADAKPAQADAAQQQQPTKYSVICHVMERELDGIIPVASKRVGSCQLFSFLARSDMDPLSRRLLERTLELMQTDYSMPAAVELVEGVQKYVAESVCTGPESEEEKDEIEVKLLVPVIGGMPTAQAFEILPKVVRVLDDQTDALINAFRRLYTARPPSISKAALFAALHRLDIEGAKIPQKKVLSSISLCLGHKEDFRSDVIREALADLLNDELPAQPLMRTAILAAQSHGNEMKKLVLGDVIPTIIRKKVWETAPKVWDGVSHAVKLLAEHKTAEPTLRCLLGLPKAQLKAVIKAVPKVKAPLGKLIVALSAEEKEEVISGRWAGIADADSTAIDAEKAKIIKDLSTAT